MKKILSISNSFGVDATRYFHGVATSLGEEVKVGTLYIGGCSLERHCQNIATNKKEYEYYINGVFTGEFCSIEDALLSDNWDFIVMQQSSPLSGVQESYFPYLTDLSNFVKKHAPTAKQFIHQTWAYPENSGMFEYTPFNSREEMITAVQNAYERAEKSILASGIIPCLKASCYFYEKYGNAFYRDDLHASLGVGRYLLACVWVEALLNKSVLGNTYRDLDEEFSEEQILFAQSCAHKAVWGG